MIKLSLSLLQLQLFVLWPFQFKLHLTFMKTILCYAVLSSDFLIYSWVRSKDNFSNLCNAVLHRQIRKIKLFSFQIKSVKWNADYLERNNMTLTSLLGAWMARLGQQHDLYVPHGFHLDGEVLSDVSAQEWRYCRLPQQVPRMELPEMILLTSVSDIWETTTLV